jgi:hypothetical protein
MNPHRPSGPRAFFSITFSNTIATGEGDGIDLALYIDRIVSQPFKPGSDGVIKRCFLVIKVETAPLVYSLWPCLLADPNLQSHAVCKSMQNANNLCVFDFYPQTWARGLYVCSI